MQSMKQEMESLCVSIMDMVCADGLALKHDGIAKVHRQRDYSLEGAAMDSILQGFITALGARFSSSGGQVSSYTATVGSLEWPKSSRTGSCVSPAALMLVQGLVLGPAVLARYLLPLLSVSSELATLEGADDHVDQLGSGNMVSSTCFQFFLKPPAGSSGLL